MFNTAVILVIYCHSMFATAVCFVTQNVNNATKQRQITTVKSFITLAPVFKDLKLWFFRNKYQKREN
jgi:hypothetical protein